MLKVEAGQYIGAEQHDRILIDLPPVQRAFAAAVRAAVGPSKPVLLLLLNGGSVDIGPELAWSTAAIEAFYPGEEMCCMRLVVACVLPILRLQTHIHSRLVFILLCRHRRSWCHRQLDLRGGS
jgi:hypothetical protein